MEKDDLCQIFMNEWVTGEVFVQPYFAFVLATERDHACSDEEWTKFIVQSFKANNGLLEEIEYFEEREIFEFI